MARLKIKDIQVKHWGDEETTEIKAEMYGVEITLRWYRCYEDDWLADSRSATIDNITWSRSGFFKQEKEVYIDNKPRSYYTRGTLKRMLAQLRKKYNLTKKQWQEIMGEIGLFLDKPLVFFEKYGIKEY